jgi:putative ABC transport system substrate-binding protein
MRRRDLLAGLLATTTAGALRAAEPNKAYRLAHCVQNGTASFSLFLWTRFYDRLRQLGYAEGKNLVVDRYAAEGQADRYADIARDVARSRPDVIVTGSGHQLILQLAKETSTIAIVALMGDPVAAGLVRSIARPEGNITGVAADPGMEIQGKFLDILRQAVPSASRIAYLSPRIEWEGAWGHAIVDAGRQSGVFIIGVPVEASAQEPQYLQAFEAMTQQSAHALVVNGFPPNSTYRHFIAELALRHQLPSICWYRDVIKAQGFLAYTPDFDDIMDRLADQADQILKGAKPADIPIYQPTKFTLAINLKTAKALGLNIPSSSLASADEVIE